MAMFVANMFPTEVFAEDVNELTSHATGGLYSPPDETQIQTGNMGNASEIQSVPSSFDISTNTATAKHFPQIGNQGEMGSCTAWATTYYQFTYEVNKGVTTTPSNTYSPTWTYNFINGGKNSSTYLSDAYDVLNKQGAMTLADLPYYEALGNYNFNWPTNVQKMLDALQYRASSNVISVLESSNDLQGIKTKIASGKVAVVHTFAYDWKTATNSDGEEFIVRGGNKNGGHFVTVVGYDDNIQVTVNGTTLTGAFKIANSWGTSMHNNGYIWVSYDTLRSSTAYNTNWESGYNDVRGRVFTGRNFYFIDIYRCKAQICECIKFTTTSPWSISLYGNKGITASTKKLKASGNTKTSTSVRYLVFDYSSGLGGSFITSAILSSQWTTKINGASGTVYNIQARLVDNLNRNIEPFNGGYNSLVNGSYAKTHTVSLTKGRISAYDNNSIESNDITLMQNYLLGTATLSSLQYLLADYNGDGNVNGVDLTLMRQAVAAANGQSLTTDECEADIMKEIKAKLNASGASFDMFMSGALTRDEAA